MKRDALGHVWVTAPGTLCVVALEANRPGMWPVPSGLGNAARAGHHRGEPPVCAPTSAAGPVPGWSAGVPLSGRVSRRRWRGRGGGLAEVAAA